MRKATEGYVLEFVLFLLLFIVIAAAGFLSLTRDSADRDDSDLLPVPVEVADEENAHTYFAEAADKLVWGEGSREIYGEFIQDKMFDGDAIQKIIQENSAVFTLIERGTSCKQFAGPQLESLFEMDGGFSAVNQLFLIRLLHMKCRYCRLNGQQETALPTVETMLRFSQLALQNPDLVINFLVRKSIFAIALSETRALVRSGMLSDADLARLADIMESDMAGVVSNSLVQAVKGDYRLTSNAINKLRDSRTLLQETIGINKTFRWIASYQFKPNVTRLRYAEQSRSLINLAGLSYTDALPLLAADADFELPEGFAAGLRPNRAGERLLSLMRPENKPTFLRSLQLECDLAATRLLIACYRYRLQAGDFPVQLSDLVPDFIEAIPRDPFDGGGFKYNAAAGLLYSVGEDLIDSDGSIIPSTSLEKLDRWRNREYSFSLTQSFQEIIEQSPRDDVTVVPPDSDYVYW